MSYSSSILLCDVVLHCSQRFDNFVNVSFKWCCLAWVTPQSLPKNVSMKTGKCSHSHIESHWSSMIEHLKYCTSTKFTLCPAQSCSSLKSIDEVPQWRCTQLKNYRVFVDFFHAILNAQYSAMNPNSIGTNKKGEKRNEIIYLQNM